MGSRSECPYIMYRGEYRRLVLLFREINLWNLQIGDGETSHSGAFSSSVLHEADASPSSIADVVTSSFVQT